MSLRLRLMASIVVALVLSLGAGAGLACWRAAHSVRSELSAAMAVGAQRVRDGVGDLAMPGDPARAPARLVAGFDGERHVVARLAGPLGAVAAESHSLRPVRPAPGWFVWLVAPALPPTVIVLPDSAGGGAVVLRADPGNEAAEAWAALGDSAVDLLVFSTLAAALTLVAAGRALRPLVQLTDALDRVGPGRYGVRVAASGAPDIGRLTAGFNRMGERLAAAEAQNHRLHDQLATIQEEERADLARDLHDEVGPLLFSINVSAAAVERLAACGDAASIAGPLGLIREDVGHVQKHVRAILARLRPVAPTSFGLAAAIADLASFWRARHPHTVFRSTFDGALDDWAEPVQEAAYRVVQEAVSNAMRHARPQLIDIVVSGDARALTVRIADDGPDLAMADVPGMGAGLGLEGMRERVDALHGTLRAGPRAGGGWAIEAVLPAPPNPTRGGLGR